LYAQDDISRIDASRASKLAFTAQHALFSLSLNFFHLSPSDISDQSTQAEISEYAGATSSCAGSAGKTNVERRFMQDQIPRYPEIVAVVIDLAVAGYCITEIWHFLVFGHWSLVISHKSLVISH